MMTHETHFPTATRQTFPSSSNNVFIPKNLKSSHLLYNGCNLGDPRYDRKIQGFRL